MALSGLGVASTSWKREAMTESKVASFEMPAPLPLFDKAGLRSSKTAPFLPNVVTCVAGVSLTFSMHAQRAGLCNALSGCASASQNDRVQTHLRP